MCFSFVTCLDFCAFRKTALTGVSVTTAVPLFFLVAFALAFLYAASGVKDVLEEESASAGLLLEGPGSGE
jgi:hypothetical protein